MVEGAVSVVAEILMPLLLGIFEALVLVLIASIRPWRYLLSPSYRIRVDAALAQRGRVAKWWHMLWGTLAIFVSVAAVVGAIGLYTARTDAEKAKSMREVALNRVGEWVAKRNNPASDPRP